MLWYNSWAYLPTSKGLGLEQDDQVIATGIGAFSALVFVLNTLTLGQQSGTRFRWKHITINTYIYHMIYIAIA